MNRAGKKKWNFNLILSQSCVWKAKQEQQQKKKITQNTVEGERGEDCGDLDLAAQA